MTRIVLVTLLALTATSAEAALSGPPFDLRLSSLALTEGGAVTVRVTPRPVARGDERYDVYLLLASVEEAAFLTPEGTWARRSVPDVRGLSTTDSPVVRQWSNVWPSGRYALAMVVVPPSGDPLDRAEWRYRPAIVWFQIAPLRRGETRPPLATVGGLGIATATAIALVWWASRRRPTSSCGP